jgi:hypothetical protein
VRGKAEYVSKPKQFQYGFPLAEKRWYGLETHCALGLCNWTPIVMIQILIVFSVMHLIIQLFSNKALSECGTFHIPLSATFLLFV